VEIVGNYICNVYIGNVVVPLSPQMIEELTITQEMARLLPTFKMVVADATRLLSDIIPYDKDSNNIKIEIGKSENTSNLNLFDLSVKRRTSLYPGERCALEGVLNIPRLLTNRYSRAFTGNLRKSLETIAHNDLEISETDIGGSLDYNKEFIQPNWTDAKLLNYLKMNLIGKYGEAGYDCYIKVIKGKPVFSFRSLDEHLVNPVYCNFIVGPGRYEDCIPVGEYQIYDDSQIIADLGARTQSFRYFDYENGVYQEGDVDITECPTLSEFYLIDSDRSTSSVLFIQTGRSNDFTKDFAGRVRNDYFSRVSNFVHMWVVTEGLENIVPGDVVKVVFAEALNRGDLFTFQHSGLWLVRRVVHIISHTFVTNLLLVRAGIDTDVENTLLGSDNRARK
jgi:hypothetical protein